MLPEEKAPFIHRLRTACGHLDAVVYMAVIGWMHPVLAEIAMATSSITVVSNANRLRKVDISPDYVRDGISEKVFETSQQPVEANV